MKNATYVVSLSACFLRKAPGRGVQPFEVIFRKVQNVKGEIIKVPFILKGALPI